MKSRITSLAAVLGTWLGLLTAGIGYGQDSDINEYVEPGGYLVLGGLAAFTEFKNIDAEFDTSLGFSLRGGYRIDSIFSIELEGNFLSGWDTQIPPNPEFGEGELTLDGGIGTLNALAYLPLGRLQPHVVVGLGGMWAQLRTRYDIDTTCDSVNDWFCLGVYRQLEHSGAFVMKFGGGIDYYLTKDWAIVLDASYILPVGELEDLRYASFNWGVRFNL